MKITINLCAFVFLFLFVQPVLAQKQISIIPKPVNLIPSSGSFRIDAQTTINILNEKKELKPAASFFAACIYNISGYSLATKASAKNGINLSIEKIDQIGEEGYILKVSEKGIDIKANTKSGIIYAMQSLLQTLPQVRTNAALEVPAMEVTDYPRFKWRGMHMDVSRHFFSIEMVKGYIELLASYKLNIFHWHLVDDQGWRIEIKKYPQLTNVGAWRVDHNDKVWSDRPQAKPGEMPTYGGFYTQEQIKEVVVYAAARNVTVVPEIEMPGHVASAIAAYPFLSCNQIHQLPMTGGNYSNMSSNYCAGNEEVFAFLENVLDEVVALFPSKYIHIGGDEVDKTSWKTCPKCQAKIKEAKLKDENELQSYFITRMEKYLIGKERKMIGWDEILEGGLAPEATER